MVLVLTYKKNEGARITWGDNTLDAVVREINLTGKPSVVLELIESSVSKKMILEWYGVYKINEGINVMISRKQSSSNGVRLGYDLRKEYHLDRMS